MADARERWQPATALADLMGISPSTVREQAVELDARDADAAFERRVATARERIEHSPRVRFLYRLRPIYRTVDVATDAYPHASTALAKPQPQPALTDVQIEWGRFVVEHEGDHLVSLRALVEAGLYGRYDHAKRALEQAEVSFTPKWGKPGPQGGRPRSDCLIEIEDAQRFAVQTNTETGRKIADVLVAHHNRYQAARFDADADALADLVGPVIQRHEAELAELRRKIAELENRPVGRPMLVDDSDRVGIRRDRRVLRMAFAAAIRVPVMEVARETGLSLGDVEHELNSWCKGVARKPRSQWTEGDFHLVVDLLRRHRGIDLRHIFTVDSEQLELLEGVFCFHCGEQFHDDVCHCQAAMEASS